MEQNKYEEALAKYNTKLDDADVAKKVAQLIEEKVPENDTKEVKKFLSWDGEGVLYHISRTEDEGWLCTTGVPIKDEAGNICSW